MDNFGRCTFDTFQNHVILVRLLKLHNREHTRPHLVLEWLLAKFTLECLPKVRSDLLAFIDQSLRVEPLLQTEDMDCTHGAGTLARANQNVVLLFLTEADSADRGLQDRTAALFLDMSWLLLNFQTCVLFFFGHLVTVLGARVWLRWSTSASIFARVVQ